MCVHDVMNEYYLYFANGGVRFPAVVQFSPDCENDLVQSQGTRPERGSISNGHVCKVFWM